MARFLTLALTVATAFAAKKEEAAEPGIGDQVMGLVNDVIGATMATANDALGYLMGSPRFAVDLYTWALATLRSLPGLLTNVFNGDAGTLDGLVDSAVSMATIVFVTYAFLAALNLFVNTAVGVKDYFEGYLVIPTSVMGQKLPPPVTNVTKIIQKEVLDKVRNFRVKGWMVPLDGQGGSPSVSSLTKSTSAAISVCMLLSATPSVVSLMRGGANKGDAEAILYTVGSALGIQYLVKISA